MCWQQWNDETCRPECANWIRRAVRTLCILALALLYLVGFAAGILFVLSERVAEGFAKWWMRP